MSSSQSSEPVRIHKVISQAGVASRREAERLILAGEVTLNGAVVSELGQRMVVGVDQLRVDGELVRLPKPDQLVVYALYKPKNCITTLDDPKGRPIITEYFPRTSQRLFPVGRLDYNAEGLILITNDGDFANKVMHPRYQQWKGYFVKIKGKIDYQQLTPLKRGPVIEGRPHRPVKAKILHYVNEKSWLDVSLQQGTNQQIKKMFWQLGFPVEKIKRYRIGNVTLDDLNPGESRKLTQEEIAGLVHR